jgi:4-oxalocrotonate tautomerase
MPYVNIKVTGKSGSTRQQKAELIAGVTDLMVRVLNKNPASTVVVIEEVPTDNWGLNGKSATERMGELPSLPEE